MSFGFDCCCCCECKQYIIKLNNDITIGIYTIKAGYYALTGPIQLIGITDDSNHSYCSWSYTYQDQYSLLLAHDTIRKRWVLKLGTAGNEDTKLYIENFTDCITDNNETLTIGPATVYCGDCCRCTEKDLPKSIDVIIGGYPTIVYPPEQNIGLCYCNINIPFGQDGCNSPNGCVITIAGTYTIDYTNLNGTYNCVPAGLNGYTCRKNDILIPTKCECGGNTTNGTIYATAVVSIGIIYNQPPLYNCICAIGGAFLTFYYSNSGMGGSVDSIGNGGFVCPQGLQFMDCSDIPSYSCNGVDLIKYPISLSTKYNF